MQVKNNRRLRPDTFAVLLLAILALPMAIPTFRKLFGHNGGFLRDLGFISGPPGTIFAWGLAILIAAVYIGFAVQNVPPVARTWLRFDWRKLVVFFAAVAAATVEEAVFRRILMDGVRDQGGNAMMQIIASALAFGGAHSIFGLIKRNAQAAWRAALITGILGGAFGIVYIIGGRSLAPCITAHFLITLALEPGLLMAAVTGEWRASSSPQPIGNASQ